MPAPTDHAPGLSEHLAVLKARKIEIALVSALVVGAALVMSFRETPLYQGEVDVLVKPVASPSNLTLSLSAPPNLDTERQIVLSEPVAALARRRLRDGSSIQGLLKNVSVDVVSDTEVLKITYRSPLPIQSAKVPNAFAAAYLEQRDQQIQNQFTASERALQEQVDGLHGQLTQISAQLAQDLVSPRTHDTLSSQRDSFVAQLGVLQQRLLDLRTAAAIAQRGGEVLLPARVPTGPISPKPIRNGAVALFAGLVLGIGLAFLRERLDESIKSRQELERCVGAPVVAVIPRVKAWRKGAAPLITWTDPKSPISEAYQTLGTTIRYTAKKENLKVLMVTSSLPGEGKSTTSANLAVSLAQAGARVLLVSADLRRPQTHRFFHLDNQKGFSDLLSGQSKLPDVVQIVGIPNLRVVEAGPMPDNPSGLLGGGRASEIVQQMRAVADFVIVDTPPVLAVADALILAPIVDGTLLLVDAGQASRSAISQARDQLVKTGAHLVGVVFNSVEWMSSDYYYHYEPPDHGAPHHGQPTSNGTGSQGPAKAASAVGSAWSS